MPPNYGGWKLIELKGELKKRGAKLSGNKVELAGKVKPLDLEYPFSLLRK